MKVPVVDVQEADVQRRFGGLARLYGVTGAQRVQRSHVVVVGIGGVGSWAVESLARSGVGRLTLVDLDQVAESNVNRQIHATTETLGLSKVDAMRARILQINPHCVVTTVEEFVEAGNWPQLLPDDFDALIDACDQLSAKHLMAKTFLTVPRFREKSLVIVGAAGGKRHAHAVELADLSGVTHDPLLANLRYRLRKQDGVARPGKVIGLTCVFSREAVQAADPSCGLSEQDGSLNCHGYGSLVSVTATFGHCAAGHVLDALSKKT